MKTSIIIGFILGFGVLFFTINFQDDLSYFLNPGALAITLGGTIAAVIVYFSPIALKASLSVFLDIFRLKTYAGYQIVDLIVKVCRESAHTSYRNIIKYEEVKAVPFLEKGLVLLADGVDTSIIRDIMERDSRTSIEKNKLAERVFRIAGSFAPMFGMMGTVIGLIGMLNRINDPSSIPAAMGLALVTTLYGLILSALVFKPISGKIRDKNHLDTKIREIIIDGVLSLHDIENSQLLKEKLNGYL